MKSITGCHGVLRSQCSGIFSLSTAMRCMPLCAAPSPLRTPWVSPRISNQQLKKVPKQVPWTETSRWLHHAKVLSRNIHPATQSELGEPHSSKLKFTTWVFRVFVATFPQFDRICLLLHSTTSSNSRHENTHAGSHAQRHLQSYLYGTRFQLETILPSGYTRQEWNANVIRDCLLGSEGRSIANRKRYSTVKR